MSLRLRKQSGLTIVELMVSILLAAMLTAGLFTMMSGQQKTYQVQNSRSTVQENLWPAMDYLQSQIRRAGYGFAGCQGNVIWTYDGAAVAQIGYFLVGNAENHFSTDGSAPDAPASDTLSIRYADDSGAADMQMVSLLTFNPSGSFQTASVGNIVANDLVVIAQANQNCTLLQVATIAPVTKGTPPYTLTFTPGTGVNPPATVIAAGSFFPAAGYGTTAVVTRYGTNTRAFNFAIDRSATGAYPPRLVRWEGDPATFLGGNSNRFNMAPVASGGVGYTIIADNIDDMQIAWACDANNNGTIVEGTTAIARQTDEWAFNTGSDVAPVCGTNPIRQVRITLVGRTPSIVPGYGTGTGTGTTEGQPPAAEDGNGFNNVDDYNTQVAGTISQGVFGRASLTVTIAPRNIR